MVHVGDRVRLVAGGISVFEVLELKDDEHAIVQAVLEAPGRYPFSVRTETLVAADPALKA
jgi:hypothetical protein